MKITRSFPSACSIFIVCCLLGSPFFGLSPGAAAQEYEPISDTLLQELDVGKSLESDTAREGDGTVSERTDELLQSDSSPPADTAPGDMQPEHTNEVPQFDEVPPDKIPSVDTAPDGTLPKHADGVPLTDTVLPQHTEVIPPAAGGSFDTPLVSSPLPDEVLFDNVPPDEVPSTDTAPDIVIPEHPRGAPQSDGVPPADTAPDAEAPEHTDNAPSMDTAPDDMQPEHTEVIPPAAGSSFDTPLVSSPLSIDALLLSDGSEERGSGRAARAGSGDTRGDSGENTRDDIEIDGDFREDAADTATVAFKSLTTTVLTDGAAKTGDYTHYAIPGEVIRVTVIFNETILGTPEIAFFWRYCFGNDAR